MKCQNHVAELCKFDQIRMENVSVFVKHEVPVLFPVNYEMTILFFMLHEKASLYHHKDITEISIFASLALALK